MKKEKQQEIFVHKNKKRIFKSSNEQGGENKKLPSTQIKKNIVEHKKKSDLDVINQQKKDLPFFKNVKTNFVNLMLGDRSGFTVIGPATIVKEIKKDPNKIQLLTNDSNNKSKNSNGYKKKTRKG